ncbi:MAG: universal stress protein [Leptolyngbyaceae cyanobacterium SL_7_1]|nr:universal stress protein [Leptolyngbyaceae cyanobacterium SL_7_1]
MSFTKILAALDRSPLSQSVFEKALELAQSNQAQLLLFHCLIGDVVTDPLPFSGELGLSSQIISQAYQSQQIYAEQRTQEIQSLLQRCCETAQRCGVATQFDYRMTDAGQGLCQAARDWGADLIVMGRRGRKGLTEVLLGSVSNYVLHHAPCAVLVIQAETPIAPSAPTSDRRLTTVKG